MIALWIIIGLVILVVGYMQWRGSYWSRRSVDGPRPVPFIGNILDYLTGKRHYAEVFDVIYNKYPEASYVGIYKMFNQPAILLRDLDLVKNILLRDFNHFNDNDFLLDPKVDPLMIHDPFVAKGTDGYWKESRSQIAPLFTPGKVRAMTPVITDICKRLADHLHDNYNDLTECEAKDLSVKYTLEIVGACAFGLDAETFKDPKAYIKDIAYMVFNPTEPNFLQTTMPVFLPFMNQLMKVPFIPKEVDSWIRNVVGTAMKQRDTDKRPRNDLLQAVMDLREKRGINEEAVFGHSLTFLLEGFETSSTALALALYELALHPDIQKRAQENVDEILGRTNGEINDAALNELSYLETIVFEALRPYPPLMVLTKLCTKSYELPPQYPNSKKTVTIEPGMVVIVPSYSIHHDKNIYENPEAFNPDHFTAEGKQARHKFSYLTFGEGPRMCLGTLFALAMIKAALATILYRYNIKPTSKTKRPVKISERSFLFAAKNGLWVKFEKRR